MSFGVSKSKAGLGLKASNISDLSARRRVRLYLKSDVDEAVDSSSPDDMMSRDSKQCDIGVTTEALQQFKQLLYNNACSYCRHGGVAWLAKLATKLTPARPGV